jgi:hypothetical protein
LEFSGAAITHYFATKTKQGRVGGNARIAA